MFLINEISITELMEILFRKNRRYHNVQETNRSQLTLTIYGQAHTTAFTTHQVAVEGFSVKELGLGLGIACMQRLDFSCHWQTDGQSGNGLDWEAE